MATKTQRAIFIDRVLADWSSINYDIAKNYYAVKDHIPESIRYSFETDLNGVCYLTEKMGGELRSRQVLALLMLPYIKD